MLDSGLKAGDAFLRIAALVETGRAQAAVDELAAAAAAAVPRWDASAVIQAIRRIEAIGVAPSRVLLLANLLRSHGFNALCARLIDLEPEYRRDRLSHALTLAVNELAAGYASEAALRAARERYERRLGQALQEARAQPPEALAQGFPDSLAAMPFYLAYQGRDDRALQAAYGEIVTRIAAAALSPRRYRPPPPPNGRIRLLFATAFAYVHSVMKMCISWIEQIDRRRFEIVFLHLGAVDDAMTQRLRQAADRFEMGPRPTQDWLDLIDRCAPHAIVYLEIGMDAPTLTLATFRLAPVQCVTWGHPQTSGLPEIDYFLTSDLMEPQGAEAAYTETLVRLPNLSVSYTPLPSAPLTLDRSRLGAGPDETLYICCQSIFKYLPDYDDVYPRIAAGAPRSRFLFLCRNDDPARARFEARLRRAFVERGLDYRAHVVFCEPLPFAQFAGFLRMGDVFLDSLGWSGANTTLEAIAVDLPIVTLPTGPMRGRHSAAILGMIGMSEAVAASVEDYIGKAVALADPARRLAYRQTLSRRKARLYGDETPIRALEDFLEIAVAAAYAGGDRASEAERRRCASSVSRA